MEIQTSGILGKNPYNTAGTSDNQVINQTESVAKQGKNALSELVMGQYFRGTIVDVRGNELVKILLNNNSTINASLSGNIMMNIGEKVIFQVKENNGDKLVITPTTVSDDTSEVVSKALLGAGIPETDKNIVLVRELMNYNQPVDKETVLNLLKETKDFPSAKISTLVEMNAHDLPVSEENIEQYDNYKNLEYKFTDQIDRLGNDIVRMLTDLANDSDVSVSRVTDLYENVIEIFDDDSAIDKSDKTGQNVTYDNVNEIVSDDTELADSGMNIDKSFADTVKELITSSDNNITPHEIATYINDNINDPDDISKIFSSQEVIKHIKQKIVKHFSLEPEQLDTLENQIKEKIDKIYERISSIRSDIEKLVDNNSKNEGLLNNNKNFSQNLNFMSDLNHLSSFVQIPVKFSNSEANAELYVYNKNRGRIKDGDTLTAFLHLDLESLGATDINVSLTRNHVQIRFSLENSSSTRLIEEHLDELKDRLEQSGYIAECRAETVKCETKSPVEQIFEHDESAINIKRYLFDIRA